MIVRTLNDLIDTSRDVRGDVWASRRFLLAEDGVGFTLTETTVAAGARPGALVQVSRRGQLCHRRRGRG